MSDLSRVLGLVIADLRNRAKMSQEELAFECGLHPTYISQIERGLKNPTIKVIARIAEAIGSKPSLILKRVESRLK